MNYCVASLLFFVAVVVADFPLVQVDTYMMSKCPYATQWVDDFTDSVLSKEGLAEIVNVTMNFIAKVDSSESSGFYSLHGQTEVHGDFFELCAISMLQDWQSWWKYIVCMDDDYRNIPDHAITCSDKLAMDTKKLQQCYITDSSRLMKESINQTDSLGWNPRPGSPTVYINKSRCISGYPPCEALSGQSLLNAVCQAYTGPKPAGCN